MPRIKEYRVVLPLSVDEYHVGQLYAVAKASRAETERNIAAGAKGEGVEVLVNEPYSNGEEHGQYTHKIYHLASNPGIPDWVKKIAPDGSLDIIEKAWNNYPHCKTVLTSAYLGTSFEIVVETRHYDDAGTQENVHSLDAKQLKMREVKMVDIGVPIPGYTGVEPNTFTSASGRGPLTPGWQSTTKPLMTAYKLVTARLDWPLIGGKVEQFIVDAQENLFCKFHKEVFTWIDEWLGKTMEDIRAIEAETKIQLDQIRQGKAVASSAQSTSEATSSNPPAPSADGHPPAPAAQLSSSSQ